MSLLKEIGWILLILSTVYTIVLLTNYLLGTL